MMKESLSHRECSGRLIGNWIWPTILLGDLPFATFFVILPNPSFNKLLFAATLLFIHFIMAYQLRYQSQSAHLWAIFLAMWGINIACYTIGLTFNAYFRWRWPQDASYILLIVATSVLTAYMTWRYYTPLMKLLLEADCRTGRFDLERGTFSLAIPPTFYEFKTPLMRRAMTILLPASGTLTAIAAASGVRSGDNLLHGKDIGVASLFLIGGVLAIITTTCALYTYRWIRRWEKTTGRTMWIKGFEPQSRLLTHQNYR